MMIASEGSGGGTSDNEANSPQTTTSFSNLPIEIVFKIIDLLPIKSILSLRAVDKQFNELVDTYTRFWRKLNYRLDLDKLAKNNALTTGLDSFEIFLNRIAPISIIDVKCESVLTRENKIELNLRHRKNGGALRTNRLVTFFFIRCSQDFSIYTIECNHLIDIDELSLDFQDFPIMSKWFLKRNLLEIYNSIQIFKLLKTKMRTLIRIKIYYTSYNSRNLN